MSHEEAPIKSRPTNGLAASLLSFLVKLTRLSRFAPGPAFLESSRKRSPIILIVEPPLRVDSVAEIGVSEDHPCMRSPQPA